MAEVGGDAGGALDVVEGQLRAELVHLQEHGERLPDASGGPEDRHLLALDHGLAARGVDGAVADGDGHEAAAAGAKALRGGGCAAADEGAGSRDCHHLTWLRGWEENESGMNLHIQGKTGRVVLVVSTLGVCGFRELCG